MRSFFYQENLELDRIQFYLSRFWYEENLKRGEFGMRSMGRIWYDEVLV